MARRFEGVDCDHPPDERTALTVHENGTLSYKCRRCDRTVYDRTLRDEGLL